MIPIDPKKALEEKKKVEHEEEMKRERELNKRREEELLKQRRDRELNERQRIIAAKKRDSDAKKRELREKELEMRILSAEVDRLKIGVRQKEESAAEKAGQAKFATDTISRDLNRQAISKKYRIEYLAKEISKMQVEIESKKAETERLKKEIATIENQMRLETGNVSRRAAANPVDEAKLHREKMQIGEKEFKLEQMNREIFALKSSIQKDDSDLRELEASLRTLR